MPRRFGRTQLVQQLHVAEDPNRSLGTVGQNIGMPQVLNVPRTDHVGSAGHRGGDKEIVALIVGNDTRKRVRDGDGQCTGCQAVNKVLDRPVIQPMQFPKPFIPQRLRKVQPVRQRTRRGNVATPSRDRTNPPPAREATRTHAPEH